jgi:CheY-like chemotaxis protein
MLEPQSAPKRLLVVEDNRLNLLIVTRFLVSFGHEFDAVDNGLDCIELLIEHNYDLVLTDISMPGMNGIDVARSIRTMTDAKRDIPIIAMTANTNAAAAQRFEAAGMNELLPKPFGKADLQRCIKKWL